MSFVRTRSVGVLALVTAASAACGGSSASSGYAPSPVASVASSSGGYAMAEAAPMSADSRASVATARAVAMPAPPAEPMAATTAGSTAAAPMTTVQLTVTAPMPVPIQQQAVIVEQIAPAGLLTAASVGDADRRDNYLAYLGRHPDEQAEMGIDMSRRVRFRVLDNNQHPVNDAQITLVGEGMSFAGRTHADGRWDFYPSVDAPSAVNGVLTARVTSNGQVVAQGEVQLLAQGDGQEINLQVDARNGDSAPHVLDLGFLVDVTGSMGDELRYVHNEIAHIVQRIQASTPGIQVRVGATFYRDRVDPQPLQMIPFTANVGGFASVMGSITASGGGDYPEDMNAGLEAALHRMQWSQGNADRVLVVIADAPPQMYPDEQFEYRASMREASQRGIRILPVAASGADRRVEYLFRAMAAYTSTPYTYLTDESGVGAPHMEADTDRVAVERFNDLLVRLVISDLRGQGMHEPGPLAPAGG